MRNKRFLIFFLSLFAVALMTVPYAAADDKPISISVAGYMYGPIEKERDVITPLVEQRLRDVHGINVDIEPIYVEDSDYSQIMNTRLVGGNAPDVFLCRDAQGLETYYDQGVIASWDVDFFKENAPNVYKFINDGAAYNDLKEEVGLWWQTAMRDGKMVTLPSFKPDGSLSFRTVMYRGDWLEMLGIEDDQLPMTLDDFTELMYSFSSKDPDGNEKKDTYGMSSSLLRAFFGAYGIYTGYIGRGNSYWKEENGKLINPDVSDEARQVIERLTKMYADGVIDPEFITGNEAVAGSYWAISNGFVNGRYGTTATASIDHYRMKDVLNDDGGIVAKEYWAINGDDSRFVYGPWPAGPNGDYGAEIEHSVSVIESAVYNAELNNDPEKLATIFKILDAFATDDELYMLAAYGIEGEHYTINENGQPERNPNLTNADLNAVGVWGCRSLYGSDRAYSKTAYDLIFYNSPTIQNRINWYKKPQFDSYITNAVTVVLPSEADLMGELNAYRDETWTKMITGKVPLTDWNKYVETYMQIGGQKMEEEANEWYKKSQKVFAAASDS